MLATAVRGHADVIVTFNLRDFPSVACSRWDVEVQHPDMFLVYELEAAPAVILEVLKEQAAATGKPPHRSMIFEDILGSLEKCGVPEFVEAVRSRRR